MQWWGLSNKMIKRCNGCDTDKPLEDFGKDKHKKYGRTSECKSCRKERSRERHFSLPLEVLMFNRSKSRAKKKNLEFSLELEDLKIPKYCPVFGKPLIRGDIDWTPSLDRVDSSKGYTKENIEIISNRANRIKNNATLEELEQLVAYYKD